MASTKLTNIDGNLPRDVLLIALRTNMPQVFRWCLDAVGFPEGSREKKEKGNWVSDRYLRVLLANNHGI